MVSVQINLRLDGDLLDRVDAARGDVPRNRWLVRAVELALGDRPPTRSDLLERVDDRRPVVKQIRRATADSARRHAPNCKCPVCS